MICECCNHKIQPSEHVTICEKYTICYNCFQKMKLKFEEKNLYPALHLVRFYIKTKGSMKVDVNGFFDKNTRFW